MAGQQAFQFVEIHIALEGVLKRRIQPLLDDQVQCGYAGVLEIGACGIEVGVRRLEARPTADLCIDCKTLDEIREKQTRI